MTTRREWLDAMLRIAAPVISHLSEGTLKRDMPLQFHPDRAEFAPLEAFGRTLQGMAPWLETNPDNLDEEERRLQSEARDAAMRCIDRAVNPSSPDYMLFDRDGQPLVDTAFLAHAIVRAQETFRSGLDKGTRSRLADALRASRKILPVNTNWLFFSAMVEAGLYVLGEPYDPMRLMTALRCFREWYAGDGMYGDGPVFHADYYNSFVIQPMYVDLVNLMAETSEEIRQMREEIGRRAARYASVLERMIGPDGSYPVIGRSICYRFAAFHMLAQAAAEHCLEKHLRPAGVRCGLTAVIRRVMSAETMFDKDGWLQPGVIGYQPELAEPYINIGSLYLCTAVFLPLGLAPSDPFWTDPDCDWTGRTVWAGGRIQIDHALD